MKYIIASIMPMLMFSCKKKASEDAIELARVYCNCVNNKLMQFPDSSIFTRDCEDLALANSRLINIAISDQKNKYSKETLDSAQTLLLDFRNITDTMCINKIDERRFK